MSSPGEGARTAWNKDLPQVSGVTLPQVSGVTLRAANTGEAEADRERGQAVPRGVGETVTSSRREQASGGNGPL